MLQIKVFQGGSIRIYNTNSFKEGCLNMMRIR
nr:MAG TPA: hypothetical protein [Bacteriophage sp.]